MSILVLFSDMAAMLASCVRPFQRFVNLYCPRATRNKVLQKAEHAATRRTSNFIASQCTCEERYGPRPKRDDQSAMVGAGVPVWKRAVRGGNGGHYRRHGRHCTAAWGHFEHRDRHRHLRR